MIPPIPRPDRPAPSPERGVARWRCDTVQQAHPGWLIFHNSQTGAWNAYRRAFPRKQETEAGITLLIRANSAEHLERKLTAQAEIQAALAASPAPPAWPPVVPRTFLRS
ncbi:hypothetical protein AB0395_03875 [Streptosporangium sp. NPDC051023]|uniref:hypothetical protein n=1 Tax=Streptosporangium sp. NPDC051023 TaxID=3155410 RepID=UPI00344C2FBB